MFKSKWAVKSEDGTIKWYSRTLRNPPTDEPKGAKAKRFARRQKIRAMKEAGHLRGDNTPWPR
jgi:hypothetical protein